MSAVPKSLRRHAVSTGEYLRMGEAGVFDRGARLELIDGEILEMAPIGSAHAGTVKGLVRLFGRLVGDQAMLSIQDPLVVNDRSVPQPDVVLLKPRADNYTTSHPTAEDALLVVEVADTTLAFDLGAKAMLYSRGGIAELWVVDLQDRSMRVFREPGASGYRTSFTAAAGQSVTCLALSTVVLAPSDLFPAPHAP